MGRESLRMGVDVQAIAMIALSDLWTVTLSECLGIVFCATLIGMSVWTVLVLILMISGPTVIVALNAKEIE